MKSNNKLTQTELEIMKYFWHIDREVTAGDVRSHFSDKNWSKQAVSSFLKKLSKQGYINIRKESISKYYYSCVMTEDEYNLMPAKDIINDFYNGSLRNFICALSGANTISEEDAARLDQLIEQLKSQNE